MPISAKQLDEALDTLELADRPIMVHTSMRSFGEPVEGGADAILDAMVSRGCTVLVPTFTDPPPGLLPPPTMRPQRNGMDYADLREDYGLSGEDAGHHTSGESIAPAMGVLPARLLAREDARRGRHPLNSFAALGPRAAELVEGQTPTDVYAPIRTLVEWGGTVLLIGVELNRMTALHLAEQRSGRRLFVRWARRADGGVYMVEVGSCSKGFPRLAPHLRPYARTTWVGTARWDAYPAAETLAVATAAMAADPGITHCPQPDCERCEDSIAGGPIGPAPLGEAAVPG